MNDLKARLANLMQLSDEALQGESRLEAHAQTEREMQSLIDWVCADDQSGQTQIGHEIRQAMKRYSTAIASADLSEQDRVLIVLRSLLQDLATPTKCVSVSERDQYVPPVSQYDFKYKMLAVFVRGFARELEVMPQHDLETRVGVLLAAREMLQALMSPFESLTSLGYIADALRALNALENEASHTTTYRALEEAYSEATLRLLVAATKL